MPSTTPFVLTPAAQHDDEALAAVFGAAYADYFVPMHVDAATIRFMVERFDLDLDASRVALRGDERVGVAMLGVRGREAWIGGMGVAPSARRGGLGRALMEAVIGEAGARGVSAVGLEVLVQNAPAIALYEALGFTTWRDLEVWSLATPLAGGTARAIPASEARAWITARRTAPEPWQRADASLDRFDDPSHPLRGLEVVERGERVAAGVGLVNGARASLLQVHATDAAAARSLCASASAWAPTLRFLNVPSGHAIAALLARAGATLEARQHEMRLELPAVARA
jgi:ribosomal protein S18 acetylase RimI-like enzyme